jgi:hypothetical protein
MSTWMIFVAGLMMLLSQPVEDWLRREPSARITSAWCIASAASSAPRHPGMPM